MITVHTQDSLGQNINAFALLWFVHLEKDEQNNQGKPEKHYNQNINRKCFIFPAKNW